MNPAPIGTRVQIVANSNCHHYRINSVHRVHQIDSDGTFRAIDEFGIEGDFLLWADCIPVGLGWAWLREHLDARTLALLSAFDGLENLRLREDVETRVILADPTLADTILRILPEVEEALAIPNHPNPDALDEFNWDDPLFSAPFDPCIGNRFFK